MKITALAGGVGGAKLAYGLYHALKPDDLTVIVNTGDDTEMFGVWISPDLDTVMYTLADLVNPETGWGLNGDTYQTLSMLGAYGETTWFNLGDKDFATHLLRSAGLRSGKSLTEITHQFSTALGIKARLIPMCNEPVSTKILTPEGELDFQDYFVRGRASADVMAIRFLGSEQAKLSVEVRQSIETADLIVICPSNPILSIWPILSVPGLKDLLTSSTVPVVAVSPIVGGKAIKGPAAKVLADLGFESSALGVAGIYSGLAKGFVMDTIDDHLLQDINKFAMKAFATNTIMRTAEDKVNLARFILDAASQM